LLGVTDEETCEATQSERAACRIPPPNT
jgi:hypothetical protein